MNNTEIHAHCGVYIVDLFGMSLTVIQPRPLCLTYRKTLYFCFGRVVSYCN